VKEVAIVIQLQDSTKLTQEFLNKIYVAYTNNKTYKWQIIFAIYKNPKALKEIQDFRFNHDHNFIDSYQVHADNYGFVMKNIFLNIKSDVYVCLDIEIIDSLETILEIIKPISIGMCDVSLASRLHQYSIFSAYTKNRVINLLLMKFCKIFYSYKFSNLKYEIKAVSNHFVESNLSSLFNYNLLFDLEILLSAEKKGMQVHESDYLFEFIENSSWQLNKIFYLLKKIVKLNSFYSVNKISEI
tara:strand:- start:2062 stop:2787 length:726 start_codon:yes stop_codon:yes gene_type:complete